jgi:hypothetical protein
MASSRKRLREDDSDSETSLMESEDDINDSGSDEEVCLYVSSDSDDVEESADELENQEVDTTSHGVTQAGWTKMSTAENNFRKFPFTVTQSGFQEEGKSMPQVCWSVFSYFSLMSSSRLLCQRRIVLLPKSWLKCRSDRILCGKNGTT